MSGSTPRRLLAGALLVLGLILGLGGPPALAQEVSDAQLQACQEAIDGFVADVQAADARFRANRELYQTFTAPGYFDEREPIYRNIIASLILKRAEALYGRTFDSLSGYDEHVTALKAAAPERLKPVNLWVLSDLRQALINSAYNEAEADYLVLSVYENIGSYECGGVAFN